MGLDRLVDTETLRAFIVVLAKETAQQQHLHEFCTLQSRIAGAEQKKALIEADNYKRHLGLISMYWR